MKKTKEFKMRLTEDQFKEIEKIADERQTSKAQIIRESIRDYIRAEQKGEHENEYFL